MGLMGIRICECYCVSVSLFLALDSPFWMIHVFHQSEKSSSIILLDVSCPQPSFYFSPGTQEIHLEVLFHNFYFTCFIILCFVSASV